VVGAGYGGLVAFWMSHLYPKLVERVVFVAAGTHMSPTSQKPFLAELDYDNVSELLLPTTVKGLRNLASVATNKRIYRLPKFLCKDVLQVGHLLKGIFSP
jgi:pimeloyl-ACP methyl ester carboxylesterase